MRNFFIWIFCLSFFSVSSSAQIAVVDNQLATTLAQTLIGTGVIISNPVLDCEGIANGIFTATSSNLGIDSGIILTSGRAATNALGTGANGLSSLFASTTTWLTGNGNDPDLDMLSSPSPTRDRWILIL